MCSNKSIFQLVSLSLSLSLKLLQRQLVINSARVPHRLTVKAYALSDAHNVLT